MESPTTRLSGEPAVALTLVEPSTLQIQLILTPEDPLPQLIIIESKQTIQQDQVHGHPKSLLPHQHQQVSPQQLQEAPPLSQRVGERLMPTL